MITNEQHTALVRALRVSAGIVRVRGGWRPTTLWTRGTARKDTTCCLCDGPIVARDASWRPLSNGADRMLRVCRRCWLTTRE